MMVIEKILMGWIGTLGKIIPKQCIIMDMSIYFGGRFHQPRTTCPFIVIP
jgi:hypothetical protein